MFLKSSLSTLTAFFQALADQNVSIVDFIVANNDGGSGDN